MGFQHLTKRQHSKTASKGGKNNAKKGHAYFVRLGDLSRKARMTEKTKKLLEIWGLPLIGSVKIRLRNDKKHKNFLEATWTYRKDNKQHYKYLGACTMNGFPKYKN